MPQRCGYQQRNICGKISLPGGLAGRNSFRIIIFLIFFLAACPLLLIPANNYICNKTNALHRSFTVLGAFLLLTISSFGDPKGKIDSLLDYYASVSHFNGSVLVFRKGGILLSKGYGFRDEERQVKNDEHTIYQIGTTTEQVTAEFILHLDSQGRLALTDKLSKYLPDFPFGDQVTLKNLLTHTSGIYNYSKDPKWNMHPEQPMKIQDLLNQFRSKPLSFEPGTKFEYSSADYILLGCIIERITGQKYEYEIRENMLHTCGMIHSGFDFANLSDDNKATGYLSMGSNLFKAPITDSSVSFAAGALYSTTGDLLRWHNGLHQYRMLPKDWQEIAYGAYKNRYALGWYIYTLYGKRFMQHSGTIPGFASFIMRQEEDDVLIVVLENMPHDELNRAIGYNILKCLYDKTYRVPVHR